jgi:hypothetical protein
MDTSSSDQTESDEPVEMRRSGAHFLKDGNGDVDEEVDE